MKENIDGGYDKVWRRKENQEDHMNGKKVPEIVCIMLAVVQDQGETTGKEENFRSKKDDEST
jgi:hypothetical protein